MSLPSGVESLSAMFGSTMASREDQYMLEAHILSMDMLLQINEKLGLREAYSAPTLDFIFALSGNASQEAFLAYYRSRIDVSVDDSSGLLTIRTQGFTPEIAQAVNREVVAISEKFINESSHRLARDQMAYAESELRNARAGLDEDRSHILRFQEEYGVLDPAAQAAANSGLTAELQAMLARHEAELKGLQAYLNDEAPQINALQAQIGGIRQQLHDERLGSVKNANGKSLNAITDKSGKILLELLDLGPCCQPAGSYAVDHFGYLFLAGFRESKW